MDRVGFGISREGNRLVERTGRPPGEGQNYNLPGGHTKLLQHTHRNIGIIGHQSQINNRCVYRPDNDNHRSKSLLVQFGRPEGPDVIFAIEQEDNIGWLEFIVDNQIIGYTYQDLGAKRKYQDDQ